MARNVEIKARIASLDRVRETAAHIADRGPLLLEQDDTFFRCPTGRLKLRVTTGDEAELIYYRRPDAAGPRESFYLCSRTSTPEALRELLTLAYGQCGRVRKQRTVFLAGRTRIHLDRVQGLGDFLELEVVLGHDEAPEAGVREARGLMQRLGVAPADLVEGAYVDLLGAA